MTDLATHASRLPPSANGTAHPPAAARDLLICPTCREADFAAISGPPYPAVRCKGCDLGIERLLSAGPPLDLYRRTSYDEAREHGKGVPCWRRFHHDVAVADCRLRQLDGALPASGAGRWVDVGCSTGAFLVQARRMGWSVGGVELDPAFCKEVEAAVGVPVLPFSVWLATAGQPNPQAPVAVVSFFDVLEHVLDPAYVVRTAANAVVPGGRVVVEAPDLDACTPEAFASGSWRHRRIDDAYTEHLWHFSERALKMLFRAHAGPGRVGHVGRPVEGRIQFVWQKG